MNFMSFSKCTYPKTPARRNQPFDTPTDADIELVVLTALHPSLYSKAQIHHAVEISSVFNCINIHGHSVLTMGFYWHDNQMDPYRQITFLWLVKASTKLKLP